MDAEGLYVVNEREGLWRCCTIETDILIWQPKTHSLCTSVTENGDVRFSLRPGERVKELDGW